MVAVESTVEVVIGGGTVVETLVVWVLQPVKEIANAKTSAGDNHFFTAGNFLTPLASTVVLTILLAKITRQGQLSGILSPDRNGQQRDVVAVF
jgi:hypothetical protein